jgi:acyl-coenzyme A synthetase/AMP-(fatty) acid ligase
MEDHSGRRWYRTGDIVSEGADGNYVFVGRKDRMVKKRGYRIELGEIEACLYRHPAVSEAAVVALSNEETGVVIKAFLSCRSQERPSVIKLKRFCVERLPAYMIPDLFYLLDGLPKTSTDKIDYQELKEMS